LMTSCLQEVEDSSPRFANARFREAKRRRILSVRRLETLGDEVFVFDGVFDESA